MNKPDNPNNLAAIERNVMEVVANTLKIDPMNVQLSSRLNEDFKITQQQRNQIKQELEDRFGINIYDETFDMMHTVGDLVNCVAVMVNN
jgi:acyl carrier protein